MEDQNLQLEKAIKAMKIEILPPEKEQLAADLLKLTEWMQPLLAVPTTGVREKLFNHNEVNAWREDRAVANDADKLQKVTTNCAENFYLVPRIIE